MSRITAYHLWAMGLLSLLAGCSRPDSTTTPNPAEKYALKETLVGWSAVEQAMQLVNNALNDDVGFRFGDARNRPSGYTDKFIPVCLIDEPNLVRLGPSFVPEGEECVLVNAGELAKLATLFAGDAEVPFTNTEGDLLALILLHELGHIRYGDSGACVDERLLPRTNLNLTANGMKARELRADAFAAEHIRDAFAAVNSAPRLMAGFRLRDTLAKVAWNFTSRRVLNDFGATILRRPDVFWDSGYSHPNTEFRILTMQYLVSPTGDSERLLEQFREARSRGPYRLSESITTRP